MKNFKINELEELQLDSIMGGTDIIGDDGDFLVDIIGEDGGFIVEDDPGGV